MNRQQRRQAERRLEKGYFPFPELEDWLRGYLKRHSETIMRSNFDNTIFTNLFDDEADDYPLDEFHVLLMRLKADDDYSKETQEVTDADYDTESA